MGIPLNIDWRQILLHLFNFAILTGGLYFLLYGPIKKFIAKREAHYRGIDCEANEKLLSAKALEEQAKERLLNVAEEIKETRIKAEKELNEHTARMTEEAKAKAEKILADAKIAADNEKRAILEGVERDIRDMTKEATAKIVYRSTEEAYEQFLDIAERDVDHGE